MRFASLPVGPTHPKLSLTRTLVLRLINPRDTPVGLRSNCRRGGNRLQQDVRLDRCLFRPDQKCGAAKHLITIAGFYCQVSRCRQSIRASLIEWFSGDRNSRNALVRRPAGIECITNTGDLRKAPGLYFFDCSGQSVFEDRTNDSASDL